MSDWIDAKAKKYTEQQTAQKEKEFIIATSDYWLKLRQQVESDLNKLNNKSVWSHQLQATPLKIVDFNGYYQVQKNTLDAVYISVHNRGYGIELEFRVVGFGLKTKSHHTEQWKIDADKSNVFLTCGNDTLIIPEQVSEHIFAPIVKQLEASDKG